MTNGQSTTRLEWLYADVTLEHVPEELRRFGGSHVSKGQNMSTAASEGAGDTDRLLWLKASVYLVADPEIVRDWMATETYAANTLKRHIKEVQSDIYKCGLEVWGQKRRGEGVLPPLFQEELDHRRQLMIEDNRIESLKRLKILQGYGIPVAELKDTARKLLGDDESRWPVYLQTTPEKNEKPKSRTDKIRKELKHLADSNPDYIYNLSTLDLECQRAEIYPRRDSDEEEYFRGYKTLFRIVGEHFEKVGPGRYQARSTLHNTL